MMMTSSVSLTPVESNREYQQTIDYFDCGMGVLVDPNNPTILEFAASLLRETLLNPNYQKTQLGAIILHLCSKKCDFKVFYSFYKDLECMISAGDPLWKDQLFFDNIFAAVVNACENNEIEDVCKTLKKSIEAKIPVVKDKCLAENDNDRTSDLDANVETFVMRDDFSDFGDESNNKEEPEITTKVRRKRPSKRLEGLSDAKKPRSKKKIDYVCSQCDSVFKTFRNLDVHLFEEHSFGSLCSQCGHQSETFNEYEAHMESHYIQCEICKVTVHGLKGLRNHNTRYHKQEKNEDKEDTMCYVCGKKLRKSYLHIHIRNVHNSETVQCDKCEFTTNTKDKLKIHMRRTHLNTLKTCPVCKKQVRMLKRHWEVTKCGGKVTPGVFTCDICNKQMTTAIGLKKHKKVIHMKTKDKHCQLCSYATYSAFNLRLHVTKVHTKKAMQTTCSVCSIRTYSIDWHMKTYHDDVPWQPGSNN